jgi:hypothetical protein
MLYILLYFERLFAPADIILQFAATFQTLQPVVQLSSQMPNAARPVPATPHFSVVETTCSVIILGLALLYTTGTFPQEPPKANMNS